MTRRAVASLIAFVALLLALMAAPLACDIDAPVTVHTVAQHRTCTKDTADYQYAHGVTQQENEHLTAVTNSCRTGAPWLILIHGGSWIYGDRSYMTDAAEQWYGYGWQTFNIEYRRGSGISWGMQKNDVAAAYDWVVAHAATFGLDAGKGTAFGFSAGGHMAAWLGNLRPVSSVVSVSGVLQPQRLASDDNGARPDTEPTTPEMHALHVREVAMMGCDWPTTDPTCRASWDAFDPETAITATSAPVYAFQGDDDPNLPGPMPDAYAYHLRVAGLTTAQTPVVHVAGLGHTLKLIFADAGRFYAARQWVGGQW